MALIKVSEPFAAAPKFSPPRRCQPVDIGDLEVDRVLLELSGVELESSPLDITDVEDLLIEDSILTSVDCTELATSTLDVVRSTLDQCDLSRLHIRSIRASHLLGTKLVGTELSGALLTDVVFERCTLRYANLRMAKLRRVRFADCQLVDVDAFEAAFEDVDFDGSTIESFNVDRLEASTVDLRHASSVGLTGIGRLRGFLIAEEQLPGLSHALAAATGLDIEAPIDLLPAES